LVGVLVFLWGLFNLVVGSLWWFRGPPVTGALALRFLFSSHPYIVFTVGGAWLIYDALKQNR